MNVNLAPIAAPFTCATGRHPIGPRTEHWLTDTNDVVCLRCAPSSAGHLVACGTRNEIQTLLEVLAS